MNALTPSRLFAARNPGRLFIDGAWVVPQGGESLPVIDPATGGSVAEIAGAGDRDVERAVAAAEAAFSAGPWPRLPVEERAAAMRRLAAALSAREADIAAAVTLEMGALYRETLGGVRAAIGLLDYYAQLAEAQAEPDERPWGGGRALVARVPVGVVAAIVPWNAPFNLTMLKLAPALAAGCTVILKPAPTTPLDAIGLAECVEDAGLPPGVVNVLPGGNATGDALVRDPRVDKVTFTGSTGVGSHIGAICGARIARQSLELGGKSAAILLDDMADDDAAAAITSGSMRLTGQACSALTRVLAPAARVAGLTEALVARFGALVAGDPFADATTLGPLAIERQRQRVEEYIATGTREGAMLACGGARPANLAGGYFLEPTLFTGVDNGMTIAREEIFGPVVSVIAYRDEADAIALANASRYGLYASILTHDDDAVLRLAPRLRSGNVSRAGLFIDRRLPYGGLKQSGVGREGGTEGLHAFQEAQTIYLPA